ncbi:NAD(P)/FAD-dependent oxidoreductase [Paenibacillus whitsoniae]|uniref:FAD-dependent monooxygenase n=1 Tax=Paenibacillus whitsoniae TaxID=2496558 RepID=A0A430J586_9BACL|nr:NAD(P)/FAD-dependent oxidoreductase [Paenibacillus whitsoniae]RTE02444.1 FAD-dependent monooxygenase [Paenibacillus whitsoniae]
MRKDQFDVIIVGGRVAGSTLAYELARNGYEVLLLDRAEFPSDTLSTHNFFNNSVGMLREMGVLDKLLQTGTPLYKKAHIQMGDVVIEADYPVVNGESHSLCIRRKYLDKMLWDHAAMQKEVTTLQGFRVTDVLWQGDTVTGVVGVNREGLQSSYTAGLVVGADGRHSTLRRLVNSERKMAVPTDYASYVGYFSGYVQEGEPRVEFYVTAGRIAILFPTSDDMHVVGLMFPLEDAEWKNKFLGEPEASFRELVRSAFAHTDFPRRLETSKLEEPIRGLLGYDNDWFQAMGSGWALVGDAISFKDPAVGQGMHDAIYSARLLTSILAATDDWAANWNRMAHQYQNELESKMMSRFHMACQITKNTPPTQEQVMVNRVIASYPEAAQAFLGIYNYANEPEALGQTVMRLIQKENR